MTIKDISALTGYSVGTVSRVLNNQPNVSEHARSVIWEAAKATGFQLNTNAKQLKQQHSNTILVLVKGRSNHLFSALAEFLQSCMVDSSYSLALDYLDEEENEVHRALQLCLERKPLGILFLGGNHRNFLADFEKISIPCVLVTGDASGMSFENLSSVSSDNRLAAEQAIDTLVSNGHRRIAVIGGEREISDTTRLRYQGCLDAFSSHNIVFDSAQDYEEVRYSYEGGYQAARNLLDRGRSFTALFAMSDVMAIGAIRALNDRGIRVPEDVSVMGFDGLQIGNFISPRLSSVSQNTQLLAQRSIEILLEHMDAPQPPRYETIDVSIQLRESIKKV